MSSTTLRKVVFKEVLLQIQFFWDASLSHLPNIIPNYTPNGHIPTAKHSIYTYGSFVEAVGNSDYNAYNKLD
jgi:hypothetical protein